MAEIELERPAFRSVGTVRARTGESAVWNPADRCLWWIDIWGRQAIAYRPEHDRDRAYPLPEMIGAVVPARDGSLVLGLETGLVRLDAGTGQVGFLSAPDALPETHRFNDAALDMAGRLVIGTMMKSQLGEAGDGVLYGFSRGQWRVLMRGFWRANGLAFSPDGGTLYVSDSHPDVQTIWTAPYDPASGIVGERRVFATTRGLRGRPDGATVDRDGNYWLAGVDGGEIYCFDSSGTLRRRVAVPMVRPTRPAFGRDALDRLYVTSLATDSDNPDAAGMLLEIDVGARGLAPVPFAG